MNKREVVQNLVSLQADEAKDVGEAYAPANIALIKYWGKRDIELNLPVTGSLSISMGDKGTHASICFAAKDSLSINGEAVDPADKKARRLFAYLDLFRPEGHHFEVVSKSTIPIGAGLASSASGFASMVKALDQLFAWKASAQTLSILARMGSGSASRSLYKGFVEWHQGSREDGMDSFAEPLDVRWPDFCVGIVELASGPKVIGSTEAMNRTVRESTLYQSWPDTVATDLLALKDGLATKNFQALGAVAEANAMAMHATMMGCKPAVCYWLPESVIAMKKVWALRESGVPLYFTMDAGPNLKLLFERGTESAVQAAFPEVDIICPFKG